MSNNALRTARKVWKQIKYNLGDRSVLELGSADDDLIEESTLSRSRRSTLTRSRTSRRR